MSHVVVVVGMSFTVAAKVKVRADGALVADARDVALPWLLTTELSITVNAVMLASVENRER